MTTTCGHNTLLQSPKAKRGSSRGEILFGQVWTELRPLATLKGIENIQLWGGSMKFLVILLLLAAWPSLARQESNRLLERVEQLEKEVQKLKAPKSLQCDFRTQEMGGFYDQCPWNMVAVGFDNSVGEIRIRCAEVFVECNEQDKLVKPTQ